MATAQSLGATIREDMTCSVCMELFTRPKMLPCQHTFCQDCLQVLASTEDIFDCPCCRLPVTLPSEGVAGLPDNRLVTSLCERLQSQTLSEDTSEESQSRSGNRCSFHPSREVQLYCKPCHLPICDQCLEEAHESHYTTSVKKAAKDRRPVIEALIEDGRNIMETYSYLDKHEEDLKKQKQQTDESINLAFNQMVQKLTEKKDQLLSQVEKNHSKNLDRIQNVKVLRKELSDACEEAEQAMEHGGIWFLRQETILTQVVGKHRGNAAPTPVQTQPAVFQPTDMPVPIFGHVTIQSLPSAPMPTTASSSTATQSTGQSVENVLHEYTDVCSFGEQGTDLKQFNKPRGVMASEDGDIFIADYGNGRIQVITQKGYHLICHLFQTVLPDGQRMKPDDVAIDGEGNLWVVGNTDSADFAVQYDKQGIWVLRTIELPYTKWAKGVAVDTRRNHILITQTTGDEANVHGEVLVFKPDGTLVRTVPAQTAHGKGKWKKKLKKFVETGGEQQQGMTFPRYITVDREGNILVSDVGNKCIYVYNEDGQFLFKFGGEGSGEGQLKDPQGICTDKSGNIIVADRGKTQLELFDRKGKFLKHIFVVMVPQAVAFTKQGYLMVPRLGD